MMIRSPLLATLAASSLFIVGCQSHFYRITDVPSGREFYTKAWLPGLYGRYGAARFTELRTGDHIALQASRAHEVTEEEAMAAVRRPASDEQSEP